MAIEKMRLVNIISDKLHLDNVLERFVQLDNFHPVLASKIVENVHGINVLNDENPYTDVYNRLLEVTNTMDIKIEDKVEIDTKLDLAEIKELLENKYKTYSDLIDYRNEVLSVIDEYKSAIEQLSYVENMDISLDDLFKCKYLKIRFGRLPLDALDKIKFYTDRPFVFKEFEKDKNYAMCMYITTPRYEGEVDNIFSSLYFERVRIPDFVHGSPNEAKESIEIEIKTDMDHVERFNNKLVELQQECAHLFNEYYNTLKFLNSTYEAHKYVVCLGERFSITGFVVKKDVDELKKKFSDIDGVIVEDRPSHSDKRLTPPTKLKNGWFTRPFSMFVEMYSLPNYDDFDPTFIVALSYSLLFGIMFGDVGQGLVLSLVGYIAYKWKHMQLGEVGIRIGLFSTLFGFVYGSVFGNEEILNPLYTDILGLAHKPVEVLDSNFIMPILLAAIGIGVVLIVCCIGSNIYILNKRKNYIEMILSHNGLCGLVLYAFIIIGIILSFAFNFNTFNIFTILLFIIVPILLMLFKEPIENKLESKPLYEDGFGNFILIGIFEMFEILLSFITNTTSFLRVAGFVLSHAGMMLVVVTMAEMLGGVAGIIVMIFGNIFVMLMEGMIAGIQVLRLEFYELFSRYYEGDGIEFISLKSQMQDLQ